MRRTIVIATIAAFGGFCLASASAYASLRYNIWKANGDSFQLGYVIGYFDAIGLMQKKDPRVSVSNLSGKNFDRWVKDVNAFYQDPANEKRPVPDAIYEIGSRARDKMLREWGLRRQGRPVPTPSTAP